MPTSCGYPCANKEVRGMLDVEASSYATIFYLRTMHRLRGGKNHKNGQFSCILPIYDGRVPMRKTILSLHFFTYNLQMNLVVIYCLLVAEAVILKWLFSSNYPKVPIHFIKTSVAAHFLAVHCLEVDSCISIRMFLRKSSGFLWHSSPLYLLCYFSSLLRNPACHGLLCQYGRFGAKMWHLCRHGARQTVLLLNVAGILTMSLSSVHLRYSFQEFT